MSALAALVAVACELVAAPAELPAQLDLPLGAPRTACVERAVRVDLRGAAAIDVPGFYGTLAGDAVVAARLPVRGLELGADARLVHDRFAQNASIKASELGAGPLAVGALVPLGGGTAAAARLVAPGSDTAARAQAGALEAALHHQRAVGRIWLDGHAALFAATWTGPAPARAALLLAAGAATRARGRVGVHAGVEAQTGWRGWGGLDRVAARLGARVGPVALAAVVTLAGADRTDLVLVLSWTHRP